MVGLSITYTALCVATDYFSPTNDQHKYKIISRKYSSSISLIFLQSVHATKYIRSLVSYPKSIDAKNQYSLLIEKEHCFKFLYQKLYLNSVTIYNATSTHELVTLLLEKAYSSFW
jgi:hypothetical protein